MRDCRIANPPREPRHCLCDSTYPINPPSVRGAMSLDTAAAEVIAPKAEGPPKPRRPPGNKARTLDLLELYFNAVDTLVKVVVKAVPVACTTAIMATEIPAAIRPYSIAVAPD